MPDVVIAHWIRYLLFLLSASTVGLSWWRGGWKIFLVYFTLWTELVGMISVGLSVLVTAASDIHGKMGLLAAHHIFYTAAIFMNLITVMVYWALIHDECLEKFGANETDVAVKCYLAHIVPGFVCIVNTWLTNSKLSKKFLPGLIFFGLIYAIVNFYMTKKTGKPIYPFLTWEGPDSLLIIAAMIAVFSLFYMGMCWIDGQLKHHSLTLLHEKRSQRKTTWKMKAS